MNTENQDWSENEARALLKRAITQSKLDKALNELKSCKTLRTLRASYIHWIAKFIGDDVALWAIKECTWAAKERLEKQSS